MFRYVKWHAMVIELEETNIKDSLKGFEMFFYFDSLFPQSLLQISFLL